MSVYIGSARQDERRMYSGGVSGDQTGQEVAYQSWYLHKKGWVVLRAKNASVRNKIAYAMKAACDNNRIGYDQSNRCGLYNAVKTKGFDPAKCTVATETDCSGLVRVCVCYGLGKSIPDFNTSSEVTTLMNTGAFDKFTDNAHCRSSSKLMNGDILVTKTKGHTVIVISGGISSDNSSPSSQTTIPSSSTLLKIGSRGNDVKALQENLRTLGYNISADGIFGSDTKNAVIDFQKKNGLSADGIVGSATQAKIKEKLSEYTNTNKVIKIATPTLRRGNRGDNVKTLQQNLKDSINANISVDGIFGSGTENALKDFQRKYNLSVDGIYGNGSYNKMKSVLS